MVSKIYILSGRSGAPVHFAVGIYSHSISGVVSHFTVGHYIKVSHHIRYITTTEFWVWHPLGTHLIKQSSATPRLLEVRSYCTSPSPLDTVSSPPSAYVCIFISLGEDVKLKGIRTRPSYFLGKLPSNLTIRFSTI